MIIDLTSAARRFVFSIGIFCCPYL